MLTEHFAASISAQTKANTGITKDAGVFFHEYQPLAAQRHVFKKSATAPNGLAVSSSHIFAAQEGKGMVHVYNREKGNLEVMVPFPEKIHSITLAAKDTVLLLGTETGRILIWEICSGRLVSTSTSHLQPVTSLAVDPTSNFFLSGSPDAMIHVWALPSILSFAPDTSRSPVHTLSTHRGPITAIVCGHSSSTSNIAVSLSEDKSAIVWNYHNGQALRTYLLPERPQALALDPADRAVYVGYGDGSLQTLNFYDEVQALTATDTLRDTSLSHRPVQPSKGTRFSAESQKLGAALSLSLSWDGTSLISGHASGKVAVWDAAKRIWMSIITSLPGPVSNLQFLEPTGFPKAREPTFKVHSVIKPKQDAGLTGGDALVPANYSLTMQFVGRLPSRSPSATEGGAASRSEFEEALTHPSFPQAMLDEGLAELATWNPPSKSVGVAPAADFMSLSESGTAQDTGALTGDAQSQELQQLKNQLASLQRVQKVTFKQLSDLREEKEYFVAREQKRAQRAHSKAKKASKPANGARNTDDDVEMSEVASASSASGESESSGHSDEEGSASSDEASSASPSE